MADYKYSLVISQYYHSRHSFIVEYPNNFINTCEKFLEDIEDYKRGNRKQPYQYGDFGYRTTDKVFQRYNVNDEGDIYVINSCSINYLKDIAEKYAIDSYRESRQYIKKSVIEEISKHHDYFKISTIVDKHFNVL